MNENVKTYLDSSSLNPDYAIGKNQLSVILEMTPEMSSPKCFIGDLVLKYLRNKDRFPIESFGNDRFYFEFSFIFLMRNLG